MKRATFLFLAGAIAATHASAQTRIGIYPPQHECDRLAPGARAIAACQDALHEYAGEPSFAFQLARALDAAGRPEEALASYRLAAERGHPAAQRILAIAHEEGARGLARDDREALRLFRLAAIAIPWRSTGLAVPMGRASSGSGAMTRRPGARGRGAHAVAACRRPGP